MTTPVTRTLFNERPLTEATGEAILEELKAIRQLFEPSKSEESEGPTLSINITGDPDILQFGRRSKVLQEAMTQRTTGD